MLSLQPLGDQAILAYCDDEAAAFHFSAAVRAAAPTWLVDVVQAYTSVAVFFDFDQINWKDAVDYFQHLGAGTRERELAEGRLHTIPCCYDLQLDLERIRAHTGLDGDEIVRLHLKTTYRIYAIGFCPGFPYLGYLPEPLQGMPRLQTPRLRVAAGSVGLTGRQTGIYTEPRPGGWNLIGRTPLELVNLADGYFPLRTGDQVRFARIDQAEFTKLLGQRL
jgi:inhibitor of KinA